MSNPTQKQQLEQAEAKVTELQGKVDAAASLQTQLDEATRNLQAAENARDGFKTRAEDAEGKLTAANEKLGQAEKDLKAANGKIGMLEKQDQSAAGKAKEQLAARGLNPPAGADKDLTATGTSEDIEALAEQFMKATMSGKVRMLAKHGEKLREHVANQARKG